MDDDLIEQRFDLHDDRLDHLVERIKILEDARDDDSEAREVKHGRRLEWIVIVLVALEAFVELLMYLHPHA